MRLWCHRAEGALSEVPTEVGIIGAMEALSGPARQVTLPCAWHLGSAALF